MQHTVTSLAPHEAMRAQIAIDAAHQGILKPSADIRAVRANKARGLLLVEPLNAAPYVIAGAYKADQSADFGGYLQTTFEPIHGSGTDMLRARVHAGLFFDGLAGA